MIRSRLLLAAVVLGLAPTSTAHARDWLIDLHYLQLQEAALGDADMSGRESGLRMQTPWFALGGGQFGVGADYLYTHYDYTGLDTRDRDLHRLAVPLDWSSGDTWTLRITAQPTVATSSNIMKDLFSRGTGDDFNLYGRIAVERVPDSGWGWRLGAGYDDRFGDPQAWPLVAAIYRQSNLSVEVGWPQASANWWPNERWRLGVEIAPAGARWHVVSDERDGAEFDYTVEAWRAALAADWSFAGGWQIGLQLGSEFDRHHDFEDDTGARIDTDAASAAFASLALRYRFGDDTAP